MKYVRIGVPDRVALPQLFRTLPSGARDFLQQGFQRLAALDKAARAGAIKAASELVVAAGGPYGPAEEPRPAEIAAKLGMPEEEAGSVASVVSLAMAILSTADLTPETFTDEVQRAFELPAEARDVVLEVATQAATTKAAVQQASKVSELFNEHLPTLTYFGTSVDLRLGFEQDALALAIPVVLVHIHTDVDDEPPVSFQMNRGQTERIVEDLKKTLDRLKKAEEAGRSLIVKKGK